MVLCMGSGLSGHNGLPVLSLVGQAKWLEKGVATTPLPRGVGKSVLEKQRRTLWIVKHHVQVNFVWICVKGCTRELSLSGANFFFPVDGNWGEWQEWSECSTTCGPGTRVRTRECDSPEPQYGGQCPGTGQQTEACTLRPCPTSKYPTYLRKNFSLTLHLAC